MIYYIDRHGITSLFGFCLSVENFCNESTARNCKPILMIYSRDDIATQTCFLIYVFFKQKFRIHFVSGTPPKVI